MESVVLVIDHDNELSEIIDRSFQHILISKFNPHQIIEWAPLSITMLPNVVIENVMARQISFDIKTDLAGLEKILDLNLACLSIYQFDRAVADTLTIEDLPENNRENILKQNGLKHIYNIEHEMLIIESFYPDFIQRIKGNNKFKRLSKES